MRFFGLPGTVYQLARRKPPELSQKAGERMRWLSGWQLLKEHGVSAGEAAEGLGISRATLYRWQRRVHDEGLRGLEERSRRPHRTRKPTWGTELVKAVLQIREEHPCWGKDKIVILLRRQGIASSASTVGRVLGYARRRGLLREPARHVKMSRRRTVRPYGVRKPRDYQASLPGDIIQMDTVDLRPLPGVIIKQFTAQDVISRWDVLETHSRATAHTARSFLESVIHSVPFPIQAVQVDGGSEFMAEFEELCQEKGIRLFVLPPRSPKLNGQVERAHRTHKEELYQVYDGDWDGPALKAALHRWQWEYNTVRPHQALHGLTPLEYLQRHHPDMAPSVSYVPDEHNILP